MDETDKGKSSWTFIDETLDYMGVIKERPEDVEFIGSKDRRIGLSGWEEFETLADLTLYHGSSMYIVIDLIIAFKDGTVMFRVKDEDRERWDHIRGAEWMKGRKVFSLASPKIWSYGKDIRTFYDLYKQGLEEESKAEVKRKVDEFNKETAE